MLFGVFCIYIRLATNHEEPKTQCHSVETRPDKNLNAAPSEIDMDVGPPGFYICQAPSLHKYGVHRRVLHKHQQCMSELVTHTKQTHSALDYTARPRTIFTSN